MTSTRATNEKEKEIEIEKKDSMLVHRARNGVPEY